MKESIGSVSLIQIMMVLIAIFISFMAATINYSKTFKLKNNIINMIEKNEGPDIKKITEYLLVKEKYKNGWSVCRESTNRGPYYRVTVHVVFRLPFVKEVNALRFPIVGETKVLYSSRDNESTTCNNS